jgi:hypothetical protein
MQAANPLKRARIAMPLLALVAFLAALALSYWALQRDTPSPQAAEALTDAPPVVSTRDEEAQRKLRAPAAQDAAPPPAPPELAPEPKVAPPKPESILQEDAAYWEQQFKDVPLPQLKRDLAGLRATFTKQADAEFDRRFDGGQFEVVEGATEPHNEPWKPGAILQMERPGGEAADQVHRVVLYQRDAPELYAQAAKVYWLEQRIQSLEQP